MTSNENALKRAVAIAAANEIRSGMRVGLGTGTTMAFALDEIARRIKEEGLRVECIPTSSRTEARARRLGIPLIGFANTDSLDIAIDGADELVPETLTLIKGRGGALLRERIVAASAARFLVIVDHSKVAERFADRAAVPVEVVAFGHEATARRLANLGLRPVLRVDNDEVPVTTDSGNLLYDCGDVATETDPAILADRLRHTVGVVDSGIFIGMATDAFIAWTPTVIQKLHAAASYPKA